MCLFVQMDYMTPSSILVITPITIILLHNKSIFLLFLGRCPLINGFNELFVKSYTTYVNHSTIALLQDYSSNQSFELHCNREGYWNWSAFVSTWSIRNIKNATSKFYIRTFFYLWSSKNLNYVTSNMLRCFV